MKDYMKIFGIILLVLYFGIANYCRFKAVLGFDTKYCSCEVK